MKVKKIDVAREQIETAIVLFFKDDAPISVHTLGSAAFQILKDISDINNGNFAFELSVRIKPEFLKLYWNKFNAAANFFKHADKDHDSELEFNDNINELLLIQCCLGYKEVAKVTTDTMIIYANWMALFYPKLFGKESQFDLTNIDRKQMKIIGEEMLKKHLKN
jgi:hypothetical protein